MSSRSIDVGRVARAVAVVAVTALPAVVATALAGQAAGLGTVAGTVLTVSMTLVADPRWLRALLPTLVVAAFAGAATAPTPAWVALVTALAAAAGAASIIGATAPASLVALLAVVAPPARVGGALVFAGFVAIGAAYGWLLARRVDRPRPPVPRATPRIAAVAAAVMGGLVGLAATITLAVDSPQGIWLPMTVLVVVGPLTTGFIRRSWERAIGTATGAAVALVIGLLGPPTWAVAAMLAVALVMVVLTADRPYRTRATFITIVVLLGSAPPSDLEVLAVERVLFTVGAGLLVAAALPVFRLGLRAVSPTGP